MEKAVTSSYLPYFPLKIGSRLDQVKRALGKMYGCLMLVHLVLDCDTASRNYSVRTSAILWKYRSNKNIQKRMAVFTK